MFKIGIGFDAHKFCDGNFVILGGVKIPFSKGILAHSDGDVLTHALMDAIIGAMALGDIGKFFPDSDQKYKGASSLDLLREVFNIMSEKGFELVNIDTVFIGERPKIRDYIEDIKKNYSEVLALDIEDINIKGTTTEGMGFTGREEGIAAKAVCMIRRKDS